MQLAEWPNRVDVNQTGLSETLKVRGSHVSGKYVTQITRGVPRHPVKAGPKEMSEKPGHDSAKYDIPPINIVQTKLFAAAGAAFYANQVGSLANPASCPPRLST